MEGAGVETVYLTKRFGFVRMALQHGAPLVCVPQRVLLIGGAVTAAKQPMLFE